MKFLFKLWNYLRYLNEKDKKQLLYLSRMEEAISGDSEVRYNNRRKSTGPEKYIGAGHVS